MHAIALNCGSIQIGVRNVFDSIIWFCLKNPSSSKSSALNDLQYININIYREEKEKERERVRWQHDYGNRLTHKRSNE